MTLPTRPLGTSGLEITTVGLGTWAIGGGGWSYGWGPQDDEQSLAHHAPRGRARHQLVRHRRRLRPRSLRGGLRPLSQGSARRPAPPRVHQVRAHLGRPRSTSKRHRATCRPATSAGSATTRCAAWGWSASTCCSSTGPTTAMCAIEESWAEMARLVAEGKVRAAGVSNFDVRPAGPLRGDPARRLTAAGVLADRARKRRARSSPWVREHGTGLLCYSPMGAGQLTDGFSAERVPSCRRRRLAAARVPRARPVAQPRPARRAAPDRRAPRGQRHERRAGLAARLGRRHGDDRRRAGGPSRSTAGSAPPGCA